MEKMCKGTKCPLRKRCARFTAIPSKHRQRWVQPQYSRYLKSCTNMIKSMSEKQSPNCCKFVYRDYSCYLACLKSLNYTRNKCVDGKGECEHREKRYPME